MRLLIKHTEQPQKPHQTAWKPHQTAWNHAEQSKKYTKRPKKQTKWPEKQTKWPEKQTKRAVKILNELQISPRALRTTKQTTGFAKWALRLPE